ncbi:MAG: HEAT repeat domain-containing protein [Planctomycetes bacterium]|nr:HEAT repeat domain-containing protein [Planctomycetota bacterium]
MPRLCCVFCVLSCLLPGRGAGFQPADPSAGWKPAPRGLVADEQRLQHAGVRSDGTSLLAFFRKRTARVGQDAVRALVRQLSVRSFASRERAAKTLVERGASAVPQLLQATQSPDAEVRRRAVECLRQIDQNTVPALVASAARLLADRKPPGAAEALLDFLPAVTDETAREAVFSAVIALAVRDGRPDEAVTRALSDEAPLRRAAAAVALCRAGVKEKRGAVRRLLDDVDPMVRLHVGLALVDAGEKDAVPVLIRLLGTLPRSRLWRTEDVLYRLAGDRAPAVALGEDEEAHGALRAAWLAWWRDHGKETDLAGLHVEPFRDWTLLVLLDEGRVLELDSDDKVRFKIDMLALPLDVQSLPGERVLVAEHGANRVTERLRDGTVLWQVRADEPLVAQRLSNGNTFIACKTHLAEVDRDGRAVFRYARPAGNEQFMRARKLPDGTIAAVVQARLRGEQYYVRLDPSGKELARFAVSVYTFGGRLDVQPDGRVLIPQMYDNRVVEYDAQGKSVREFPILQPIAATRLANGNTLITSMLEKRAVEFDLAGKVVWEYKATTRVTRAYRR